MELRDRPWRGDTRDHFTNVVVGVKFQREVPIALSRGRARTQRGDIGRWLLRARSRPRRGSASGGDGNGGGADDEVAANCVSAAATSKAGVAMGDDANVRGGKAPDVDDGDAEVERHSMG